jgi:RES domain-containing protein
MRLWRLQPSRHPVDGVGASLFDGRWHFASSDVRILYASESLALAALEVLVNTGPEEVPGDLTAYLLELPDELTATEMFPELLPPGWDAVPPRTTSQEVGMDWLRTAKTPLLRVPSVIVPEERNVLLNLVHPALAKVVPNRHRPFSFDSRLWRTTAAAASKPATR